MPIKEIIEALIGTTLGFMKKDEDIPALIVEFSFLGKLKDAMLVPVNIDG